MDRLSVVIITKNEEKRIEQCLESIKWVDEIIIVDDYSQDNTVGICRKYTEKIYFRKLDSFSVQKQFGVNLATGEWVLILDSDEILSPGLQEEIKDILKKGSSYDGFFIWRKTFYLGKWIKHSGWYVPIVRLFRRTKGKLDSRFVHEKILVDGKIGYLTEPILHYSYQSIDQHIKKLNIFTTYDAKEVLKRKINITFGNAFWYLLIKPFLMFVKKFIILRGFMDGIEGFIISVFTGLSVFLTYTKVWEYQEKKRSVKDGISR